jgi:hypothetical protein
MKWIIENKNNGTRVSKVSNFLETIDEKAITALKMIITVYRIQLKFFKVIQL